MCFTVKKAPWQCPKKSENGSKNSLFVWFWLTTAFFVKYAYFWPERAEINLIGWETKELVLFFSQNWLFQLKFGDFVNKSENRSKSSVFRNFWLKSVFFVSQLYFQSGATYNTFKAPKRNKLRRFSGKKVHVLQSLGKMR